MEGKSGGKILSQIFHLDYLYSIITFYVTAEELDIKIECKLHKPGDIGVSYIIRLHTRGGIYFLSIRCKHIGIAVVRKGGKT